MKSTEDKVPGQSTLDRDFSGFKVADFTDQNLVRVVSEDRPQHIRKRHIDIRIDWYLNEPLDVVLDGVFRRNNFCLDIIQFVQGGIQRCRFPGTRRARHKDDPIRLAEVDTKTRERCGIHADLIQVQLHHRPVENSHHDGLAEHCWQHTDTKVDRVPANV